MAEPFFSVLMPVYNVADYVGHSIESILHQTDGDFEFLIIDDGSTDETATIVESYDDPRIRFVRNATNQGLIPTLNRGLELARGRWIARQDGDDFSQPERLERQRAYITEHPNVAVFGTQATSMDANGTDTGFVSKPLGHTALRWFHLFDNGFIHTSVVFNAFIVRERFGGYRGTNCCGDFELWSRILAECPVANLPDPLVSYREHAASIIGSIPGNEKRKSTAYRENLSIIHANLDRTFDDGLGDGDAAALFLGLAAGLAPTDVTAYIAMFEKTQAAYEKKYPEASSDAELRRLMAAQLCRAGYTLLEKSRSAAYALLRRGVAIDRGVLLTLPLLKIAALTLFGSSVRTLYGFLSGRR